MWPSKLGTHHKPYENDRIDHWDAEELEAIMDPDRPSDMELSIDLSRSVKAIRSMRGSLKQRAFEAEMREWDR